MKATLFGLLVVSTISAQSALIDFQFNDAINTSLNNTVNSGTDTTSWDFRLKNPDQGLTDGAGSFAVGEDGVSSSIPVDSDATRKVTFASALTTGTYTFDSKLTSWNLTGSYVGQGINLKLGDTGSNTVNLLFDWRAADNIRSRHSVSGTVVGTAGQQGGFADAGSNLYLRVIGDLDLGTFTSSYSTDGVTYNPIISDGTGLTNLSEIKLLAEGDTAWNADDFVAIDYITLTVPEPSSYAMLAGAMALTSVMLRRRRG